jgi:hypothetical protein
MTLTVSDCKAKLARAQAWIRPPTLGGYIGIESSSWVDSQYQNALAVLKADGCDYAIVKCYEHGTPVHGDNYWLPLTLLADYANKAKLGIAPYIFCHPTSVSEDSDAAIGCAKEFGGVILDCEDEWVGHATELNALIGMVRKSVPNAVIIVSGYADPITRFPDGKGGTNWPFDAIQEADAYQAQFYIGGWQQYLAGHDFQSAIFWADHQLGLAFTQHGLTNSFPVTPALSVVGILGNQTAAIAQYLYKMFSLSLAAWEYQYLHADIVAALKFAPTPITRPEQYHVIHGGFSGFSEFSGGFTDDCGPCAEMVAIATIKGFSPNAVYMTEIRRRDIAHQPALFTPGNGNTIDNVYTDVTTVDPYKVPAALYRLSGNQLSQMIITAIMSGKVVIINLANAGALPHNEPGVKYHFVTCGGYDSVLGFYIANGDYWTGSGVIASGPTPLYWVTWAELTAAQPFAILVLG